jgi:hypothetical protein
VGTPSKPLGHADESGFEFAKEMLQGEQSFSVNFDRIQYDNVENRYVVFEFLLCEEEQGERGITPYSSHPRRYWYKNKEKFLAIWRIATALKARLLLVNYAKAGTKYSDQVLLIDVLDMNDTGIVKERQTEFDRRSFGKWFREQNARCAT